MRSLPQRFGNWQVISVQLKWWAEKGVLEEVYKAMGGERTLVSGEVCIDATMVKTHPDAHGAEKKDVRG
jgi:hypothetical protein